MYDVVVSPTFRSAAAGLEQRVAFLTGMFVFAHWPPTPLYFLASWMKQETLPKVGTHTRTHTQPHLHTHWHTRTLTVMALAARSVAMVQGERLFSEGDPVAKVYIVGEGQVDLLRTVTALGPEPVVVETLFPGSIITHEDVLTPASVRTVSGHCGNKVHCVGIVSRALHPAVGCRVCLRLQAVLHCRVTVRAPGVPHAHQHLGAPNRVPRSCDKAGECGKGAVPIVSCTAAF